MRAIILCKAPVAGKVKTRLMPDYSAQQAADIHKKMVDTVLGKVNQAKFEDVWLAVDDINHVFFQGIKLKYNIKIKFQGIGSIGEKINNLMLKSFAEDESSIIFLGTDSPHISIERYTEAMMRIQSDLTDVVIGPVEDGGYDLIALKYPNRRLFEDISWGSKDVYEETIQICKALSMKADVLDMSFDLDRSEDIKRSLVNGW